MEGDRRPARCLPDVSYAVVLGRRNVVVRMATFSVQTWLASVIGCEVGWLALVLPSGDGRDALFALDCEPTAKRGSD
jgi:hypothetical protein